jgi:hypothetical protein
MSVSQIIIIIIHKDDDIALDNVEHLELSLEIN